MYPVSRAGLTALSDRTNIVSNTVLTIAWSEDELREATAERAIEIAEFDEDAQAIVEVWAYSPKSLATGATVDPLSLFLCFRDDPDERIQAALEQLVEEIK